MAIRATTGRFSKRVVLEKPLTDILPVLGEYMFHNLASDGSGEFALSRLLAPGAWARDPMGDKVMAAAALPEGDPQKLKCPVSFLYGGTHDWMSAPAGAAVVQRLQELGVWSSFKKVSPGGHHLYLESPGQFNADVVEDVRKAAQAVESQERARKAAAGGAAAGGAAGVAAK